MSKVIKAPDGFLSLRKGLKYYMVSGIGDRVMLVYFDTKRNARLQIIGKGDYQDGLAQRKIIRDPEPVALPEWLASLEGTAFDSLDRFVSDKSKAGETHEDGVDRRLAFIWEAVLDRNVLTASNPNRLLNSYARKAKQNETRYRNWFFIYMVFGNKWALLPAMFTSGTWDRQSETHKGKKFGRPSRKGRFHGSGATPEMVEKIREAFAKRATKGKSFTDLYVEVLLQDFKCVATRVDGKAEFMHPSGDAFPTYDQLRYHCKKLFTQQGVQHALRGDQSFRGKIATPLGRYSSALGELNEKVNTDARYTKDHPRSFISKEVLPKMHVVEVYDGLSGFCTGIGFGIGAEVSRTYLAAAFCMAIPKSRFGEIIGHPISDEDWPSVGLPAVWVSDRGPGASRAVIEALARFAVVTECTPSYTPQSNSPAESKHPRAPKTDGAPEYRASELNPVQMAKREVERVMFKNRSDSVIARATADLIYDGVRVPLDLWKALDGRMRNQGNMIAFEDAVRAFLTPVKFDVTAGILSLHGITYGSEKFRSTRIGASLKKFKGKIDGFVLEMAVRKAWVDVDGKIVEVEAQLPIRGDEGRLAMSLYELQAYGEMIKSIPTEVRNQRLNEKGFSAQKFKDQTGLGWDEGTTRTGRAKSKSKLAIEEVSLIGRK